MSYFAAERQYKGTANKEIISQPQPPTRLGEKHDAGSGPSILAKGPDEKVACMLKIAAIGSQLFSNFEKEAGPRAARYLADAAKPGMFSRAVSGAKNLFTSAPTGVQSRIAARAARANAAGAVPTPNPAVRGSVPNTPARQARQAELNAAFNTPNTTQNAAYSNRGEAPTSKLAPDQVADRVRQNKERLLAARGGAPQQAPPQQAPQQQAPQQSAPQQAPQQQASPAGGQRGEFVRDANTGEMMPQGYDNADVRYLREQNNLQNMGQYNTMKAIEAGGGGSFSGMDKFKARAADIMGNPIFQAVAPMAVSQIPVGSETTVDEYGRPVTRTKTLGETPAGMLAPAALMAGSLYKGPLKLQQSGGYTLGNPQG